MWKTLKLPHVIGITVTLIDSNLKIPRRLEVYETDSLYQVHEYMQVAMGWDNYHCWSFQALRHSYRTSWDDGEAHVEIGTDHWAGDCTLLNIINFWTEKPTANTATILAIVRITKSQSANPR